jgi:hypothetical protein
MSTEISDKISLVWQLFLMFVLAASGALLVAWIIAPKKVDGYYLSRGQAAGSAVCVYAHWTWHPDEQAFCTDRYDAALEFAAKANATVK